MTILFQAKFLFLVILFSSLSQTAYSDTGCYPHKDYFCLDELDDYTDDTICWILYVGVYSDLKPQDRMIVRQQLTKRGIACIENKATKRINSNRENYYSDNNKSNENKSSSSDALPNCKGDYWDNCVGTYTYDNGDKYTGEWKNNKKHGQGTYTWAHEAGKYVGEWKEDLMEGEGTYTYVDGEKDEGIWKRDTFIKSKTLRHNDKVETDNLSDYKSNTSEEKKIYMTCTNKYGLRSPGPIQIEFYIPNSNEDTITINRYTDRKSNRPKKSNFKRKGNTLEGEFYLDQKFDSPRVASENPNKPYKVRFKYILKAKQYIEIFGEFTITLYECSNL